MATSAALAIAPSANYFEIDADYGSVVLPNGNITDGGATTSFSVQGSGQTWTQSGLTNGIRPYNGQYMYVADCTASPTADNDRAEHKMLTSWEPADGQRYFSLAFCIPSTMPMPVDWHFISQWWQDSTLNPPLFLAINGGELTLVRRYSTDTNPNKREVLYSFGSIVPDQWYQLLVSVKLGPEGDGSLYLYQMNMATGLWEQRYGNDALAIGLKFKGDGSGLPADMENFTWKVGSYRGATPDTTNIYYDNIRYGRLWSAITRNKLTGYHKCLLNLAYEETSGIFAADTGYSINKGTQDDPYTDYNNDATLVNGAAWNANGNVGRCLQLDGINDHVRVTLDTTDFDTGNYITAASWFKTDTAQSDRSLILIDDVANTYKMNLSLDRDNRLRFVVRHPDNSTSEVTYTADETLCDDFWRHAIGTYNRYAPDGHRLKLYLDGVLVASSAGEDMAVKRGDYYLYAGKYANNYFKGSLDETQVFNYEYLPLMRAGDANNDGQINLADLQILGDHWLDSGVTWAQGDVTGDRMVNLADLQVLGDFWGFGIGADLSFDEALELVGLSIPEPGVLSLMLGAWLLAPCRGRERWMTATV
ncbi:MAG: heparin lyase I family protein [Phycisphaeraceae bacterium]|nr:heparin lyase I family protein [Phycisphaeraceae bacterium]